MIYYILLGRILQLPRGKGHKRTSRSYSKVPHLTHPPIRIRKTATAPGSPYSFRIVRGFFYVPQNYQHSRNCETGPPTDITDDITKAAPSPQYLSVGPVGVSESRTHDLPRHSPVHNQVSYLMIFVLFKNLKYQTLTFICLSLAVGLVVAFGPRLLGGRVGLLPYF